LIITTDSIIRQLGVLPGIKIAIVKKLMHLPSSIKQIFVDDIGIVSLPRSIGASRYENIEYARIIAKKYIKGLTYGDRNIIIIDASSGFDIGVALAVLEDINRNIESLINKKIRLIIMTPSIDYTETILARLYSFLKVIFIYDIFLNTLNDGIFTYTFIDRNNPVQLFRIMTDFYHEVEQPGSAIIYELKRYYLPIKDMIVLMNSINERAKLETALLSMKMDLAILNTLLDKAQPELWDYVKNKRWNVRSIVHKIRKGYEKIVSVDNAIVKTISENMSRLKYTELIVNPKNIIELLLQGIPYKRIYEHLLEDTDFEKILRDEKLLPLSTIVVPGYEKTEQLILVSKTLSSILRKYGRPLQTYELETLEDELIKLNMRRASICEPCTDRKYSRIHRKISYAYNKLSSTMHENIVPSEIRIGNTVIYADDLVKCRLINYNAWRELGDEKKNYCPILYDKLKEAGI